VHGKAGRRGVTSDWMAMERARGISITSAALRFDYRDMVLNLLDTPGHADFSEDTYRVLSAVDAAIMLLDSAKGLEPQTLKLFDVCRSRGVPVITFVNKWDRPGREPLELLDEIEQRIGLRPAPVNWPVGVAGDFRGLIDRASGDYTTFTRTPGGAGRALETRLDAAAAADRDGEAYAAAQEELALLEEVYGPGVDMAQFLAGVSSPVLFGAALPNFGVRRLLDVVTELAPPPTARRAVLGPGVQGAGQHGPGTPGPDGVRAGVLRPVRARHGAHPRRHRAPVRHQVRPVDVRPGPGDRRGGLPGRCDRPGQRDRAPPGRHAVRRRGPGRVPAHPELRARVLRGGAR
jgi:small GTP-binding protein